MKKIIVVILSIFSSQCYGQEITQYNFKNVLKGKWEYFFCDSNWMKTDWICTAVLDINSDGTCIDIRTCKKPKGYPEDEVYDSVYVFKEKWTKYDPIKNIMYWRIYQEWDNSWSDESVHFHVISISKDEIKVEWEGSFEEDNSKIKCYTIYHRLN